MINTTLDLLDDITHFRTPGMIQFKVGASRKISTTTVSLMDNQINSFYLNNYAIPRSSASLYKLKRKMYG